MPEPPFDVIMRTKTVDLSMPEYVKNGFKNLPSNPNMNVICTVYGD